MGSTHAGHTPADKWPLMPRGGYQRAIPRDALTGEPIRPDTIHKRAHDPLSARDNGPHSERKRNHHARQGNRQQSHVQTRPTVAISHEPLPVLQLDDLAEMGDAAVTALQVAREVIAGHAVADTADVEGQASDE